MTKSQPARTKQKKSTVKYSHIAKHDSLYILTLSVKTIRKETLKKQHTKNNLVII